MWWLIIYLIGFIVTYYLARKRGRKEQGKYYNWGHVFTTFTFSGAWPLAWLLILIWEWNPGKPPKFL